MLACDRTRLIKFLNLLSSDHDGEIANAGRAANKFLKQQSLSWDEVIIPASTPMNPRAPSLHSSPLWDWRAEVNELIRSGNGTAWERSFAYSLLRWRGPVLTTRQEETLQKVTNKYFVRAA